MTSIGVPLTSIGVPVGVRDVPRGAPLLLPRPDEVEARWRRI
jgi:hypothetical protein